MSFVTLITVSSNHVLIAAMPRATEVDLSVSLADLLMSVLGYAALTVTLVVVVVSGRVARPIPMTISTFLTEVAMVTIAMSATTCSRRRVGISFVH